MDATRVLQQQFTGIAVLDRDLNVIYLNESAESLLNTSIRRASGKPLSQLIRDGEQLARACHRVMQQGGQVKLRNHEMVLPASVVEKHLDCIVSDLDESVPGNVLLELIEAEPNAMIVSDSEFYQRQQSNQAVIRGMAHEIRNPLGGIRGAAQLLSEEAGSEAFAEYTRIIIQEADRLTELVNRMQASTRANLDEAVNIHRVIEHVRQLLQAETDKDCRFLTDYDPSLPRVQGNRDLLIQALLNVMRNAAEATCDQDGDRWVKVRTRIDNLLMDGHRRQVVRVEVIDNGPGIDEGIGSQIFDPMVTGKPGGTGLGLPITAEIVAQHGGGMDYSSGQGETVFRLFLPTIDGGGAR